MSSCAAAPDEPDTAYMGGMLGEEAEGAAGVTGVPGKPDALEPRSWLPVALSPFVGSGAGFVHAEATNHAQTTPKRPSDFEFMTRS